MVLKDEVYEFVMTDNNAVFTTDKIKGYLEAFIFETNKPISFEAVLDDFPDRKIWEERSINGNHFIIIRYESFKNSLNMYNYQYERFPLLNKIRFSFRGEAAIKIKLTVRYNNA